MVGTRRRALLRAATAGATALGLAAVVGVGSASATTLSATALRAALDRAAATAPSPALITAAASFDAAATVPTPKLAPLGIPSGETTEPIAVAASPNGKTLYVADDQTGLFAINLKAPGSPWTAITQAGAPLSAIFGLAVSPDGRHLYITGSASGGGFAVLVADVGGSGATNNTVVSQIGNTTTLGGEPTGLALASNGKTLYVGAIGLTGSVPQGSVSTIRLSSPTAGTVIANDQSTKLVYDTGLALSPNGKELYAANLLGPGASMRAGSTGISDVSWLPELDGAFGVAVSPDGKTLYASVSNIIEIEQGTGTGGSELDTYAISGNGLGATLQQADIASGPGVLTGVELSPNGTEGYADWFSATEGTEGAGTNVYDSTVDKFAIPAAASKVMITGTAKVGSNVMAKVTGAAGSADAYAWYANGKAIKGASKSKLTLTSAVRGKTLTVKVTATAVGYSRAMLSSKGIKVS